MKETIRTLLSRAGEAADLDFEDYENDGQRELLMNAYWERVCEENKYELLDTVDKKNVGLYGRGHTKLNIIDGMPRLTVHDAFDVLVLPALGPGHRPPHHARGHLPQAFRSWS